MNSRLFNPLLHAGVMFVLPVATEWLWWNLGGPAWLEFFEFVILVVAAAYLLVTPVLVVRLVSRTTLEYVQILLPCCLAVIPALFAGMYLRGPVGDHELAALTHRSQQVLAAIETFEKETGSSPATLDDWVPKHLAELPTTGMVSFPSYEYSASPDQQGQWSLIIRLQPPWEPKGYLIYKPQERYGQNRSDSYCKYVGTWGYKWPEP
ncbi:MAG: hypothetical protein JKY61_05665 [Planctomycetes bacterium]|nr:hypothetical protein [Planctomycetota bacterium]